MPFQWDSPKKCTDKTPPVVLLSKKTMTKFTYKQQYGIIAICKDEAEQMGISAQGADNGCHVVLGK